MASTSASAAAWMSTPSGILLLLQFDFGLGETEVNGRDVSVSRQVGVCRDLERPSSTARGDISVLRKLRYRDRQRRLGGERLLLPRRGQPRRNRQTMSFEQRQVDLAAAGVVIDQYPFQWM